MKYDAAEHGEYKRHGSERRTNARACKELRRHECGNQNKNCPVRKNANSCDLSHPPGPFHNALLRFHSSSVWLDILLFSRTLCPIDDLVREFARVLLYRLGV